MDAHLSLLKATLQDDPRAVNWAKLKLLNEAGALACEKARWELTNNYIKPEVKKSDPDWMRLCAVALVTLPFDRANACMVVKLNRDDPECPNGFLWINEHCLKKHETVPEWGEEKQCHSIARAYDAIFAYTLKNHLLMAQQFDELLECQMPHWMAGKFGLGCRAFP